MWSNRAKLQAQKFLQTLTEGVPGAQHRQPSGEFIRTVSTPLSAAGVQAALFTQQVQAGTPALNQIVAQVATSLQPIVEHVTERYTGAQTRAKPLLKRVGGYLTTIDEQWQTFVQTNVDPLMGKSRGQHRSDLGTGLSEEEKDINRKLLVSIGNLGVATISSTLFAPLALVNAGAMIWGFLPMYQQGIRTLVKERRLTYNVVLMGAQASMILGGHFIAGGIALLMVTGANKIIVLTEDHFRRDITDALGQQPSTVWRLIDGVEVKIPLASVCKGDTLVFGAGEMIVVDGVITKGYASIDQHRLTGEAQPVEKGVDDTVLASTILLVGKIHVEVERAGLETSAAQIAVILQRVAKSRIEFTSKMQNFVDGMTLPMLTLGGIALATLGTEGAAAIMAVGVGSVARFGGPISMLSHLNVAAHHGVLIKDARSFETLKRVDTIVFDKTGTLTVEQPKIRRIHLRSMQRAPADGAGVDDRPWISEEHLLSYAAAAESRQAHPIARAIVAEAQARNLVIPRIEEASLKVGYGIKCQIGSALEVGVPQRGLPDEGFAIHVGSRRFLETEGIEIPEEFRQLQDVCHTEGHSLVLVALGEQLAGAIELEPTLRPEAREAVTTLRQRGFAIYILSGDHTIPTQRLAKELGVEHYIAEVLPQEKAQVIEQLKADGRTVCFVGDGINDSLGLFKADVSVSLHGASTLATDTAQIVLMGQDLRYLDFSIQLAQDFDTSLQQLFRLTLVPVGLVVSTTFFLQTGINFSTLIWQLGVLSGVALGFQPLKRYARALEGTRATTT